MQRFETKENLLRAFERILLKKKLTVANKGKEKESPASSKTFPKVDYSNKVENKNSTKSTESGQKKQIKLRPMLDSGSSINFVKRKFVNPAFFCRLKI